MPEDWEVQAFLVEASIYTGHLLCPFDAMHKRIEELAGRPVFTHELGTNNELSDDLKEQAKPKFVRLSEKMKELFVADQAVGE
jgi:hypothetical protein